MTRRRFLLAGEGVLVLTGAGLMAEGLRTTPPITLPPTPTPPPTPEPPTPELAVPLIGSEDILQTTQRFAPMGASQAYTIIPGWRAPDGEYVQATPGNLLISDALFQYGPQALQRRKIELTHFAAVSAMVNVNVNSASGNLLSALGNFKSNIDLMANRIRHDPTNAYTGFPTLALINEYNYVPANLVDPNDRQRANQRLLTPEGFFGAVVANLALKADELITRYNVPPSPLTEATQIAVSNTEPLMAALIDPEGSLGTGGEQHALQDVLGKEWSNVVLTMGLDVSNG